MLLCVLQNGKNFFCQTMHAYSVRDWELKNVFAIAMIKLLKFVAVVYVSGKHLFHHLETKYSLTVSS